MQPIFNRRRILAPAIVILIVVSALTLRQLSGPRHNGRHLKDWLAQLQSGNPANCAEARSAIVAIGTNALPDLMEWFNHRDIVLEKNLQNWMSPYSEIMKEHSEFHYRHNGKLGLQILGPIATPSLPEIRVLLDDPDPTLAEAALTVMARIAPGEIKARYRTALDDPDPKGIMAALPVLVIVAPEDRSSVLRASANPQHQAFGRKIIQELVDAELPRSSGIL